MAFVVIVVVSDHDTIEVLSQISGPANERSNIMKEDIQPKYVVSKVSCNCGNTFETRSTKGDIHVEICSKCHPFYTGQQKANTTRGAIEKFNRKYGLK